MTTGSLSNPEAQNSRRSLLFHLLGIPASYLLTSYFSNFHSGYLRFVILGISFQVLCGLGAFVLLKDAFKKASWRDSWASLVVLIVAGSLAVSSFVIVRQFPTLFDLRLVSMEASLLPIFLGLTILSTPGTLWLTRLSDKGEHSHFLEKAGIVRFAQKHRAGIFLALAFFLTYFIFTQTINFPGYYTRDKYFETDISDWIERLASQPTDAIFPVRAVHPAVMLILRLPVELLSILLNGDKLQAAFVLSALAGSACVFVAWLIVKQRTGNTTYALISASLLGASASHLLLSSMLETYIFSALALISFCFLLQSDRISLKSTVPVGVAIFGITITNLAQACILYFSKLPRIKVMIQFVSTVALITLLLNALQVELYPFSEPLYDPSKLLVERRYTHEPFGSFRQFGERVNLISRAVLLYGIVAPTPYVLLDEPGAIVPNFRTFRVAAGELHVAGYKGLADITIKIWVAVLGLAMIQFVFDFFRSRERTMFTLGLLLCLVFNFGLHLFYGDDPLLYSPDWVYALVLLVSFSFERRASNRWLQIGSIVFLALTIYINLGLIHQIMSVAWLFHGGN